ncbi:MAG TPA: aspartyl protease family protein [Candidatus Bathyarchaeia archaeon]|nr:aspartyl protease family protein [Candidatus Bathyarchaeia archaeon]
MAGAVPAEEPGAPFTFLGEKILVPVAINGIGPYPFVLDVCAPGTVIDSEVATFVKLPAVPDVRATRPTTSGKEIGATGAQVATLEAGKAVCRNLTATVLDLRTFKQRLGAPVAGVLTGREFGGHVRIDFAAGGVDFSTPETPLAATNPGVVPFELADAGTPVVSGMLDGQHVVPFAIDTTLVATMSAPESVLRELGLIGDSTPRLELDAPPTGEAHPGQTQVRLNSVRVGAAEIREPICSVGAEGQLARLGTGFLRRFRVTLDFNAKLVRFEAIDPAQPPRDPPLHGYGVGLWRFNGENWMIWVAQKGPAARAGLVSGGILTGVDGKDVSGMGYDAVVALLQPHGDTKITLSVLQGDDTHTVELVPEDLL